MAKARLSLGLGRLGAASHVALRAIVLYISWSVSFVDEIAIHNAEYKMYLIPITIRLNFN